MEVTNKEEARAWVRSGHVECREFLEAHGIQLDHVHARKLR